MSLTLSETKIKILKLLSKNSSLRAREIVDRVKSHTPSVHHLLRDLVAEDLIFYKYGEHPDNSSWIKYYSLNWEKAFE